MTAATALCWMMAIPVSVRRRFLSRSAASISAGLSCRWIGRWKQRFSGIRTQNGVLSAGELLFPALIGRNTARIVPSAFTGGRKQKVNGKGGRAWTIRGEKILYLWGFPNTKPGQVVFFIANSLLNRKLYPSDDCKLYYPI